MIASKAIALTKLYEASMHVCGDVIELGVGGGDSLMWWIQASHALDSNPARHFYGFDTFKGFPSVSEHDGEHTEGEENHGDCQKNIVENGNKHLGQVYYKDTPRVELVVGDICETLPVFIESHKWMIPALVHIDCDTYQPTYDTLVQLVPRMPKYAILAFDEVGFSRWPGETKAFYDAFEELGIPMNEVALQRCPYYLLAAVVINDDRGTRIW